MSPMIVKIRPKTKQHRKHEEMNNNATHSWELIAEELTPQDLRNIAGGSSSTPHDLVTPEQGFDRYIILPPSLSNQPE